MSSCRTPLSFHRLFRLILTLVAGVLVVPLLPSNAYANPADPSGPAAPVDKSLQVVAEQALDKVEEMLDPASATSPAGDPDADLTTALAEVAATQQDLPPRRFDDAQRLLARPTDGTTACTTGSDLLCYDESAPTPVKTCSPSVCVHYVTSGPHKSSTDYVNLVLTTVESVASSYVAAGYRPIVPDGGNGGTSQFDVYLGQMLTGYYAYCVSEPAISGSRTAPGYCALDNNYTDPIFGSSPSPAEILHVTTAHEYFHVVQSAYDAKEDPWFREATSTWVEEQLYDSVNDNRQFLRSGPLGKPDQSLDDPRGVYGAWIFFQYLSERYPAATGGMPLIVRQMWERASHSGVGARSMTSLQAIGSVLAERGTDFRTQFAWFTLANRRPGSSYSEGSAFRKAPLWRKYSLRSNHRSASASTHIKKRAARHVRFKSKVSGRWKLRVEIDVAKKKAGGYAIVTIKRKGRPTVSKKVKINKRGKKTVRYPFGSKVKWVEIDLVNASTRTRSAKVSARAVR